MNDKPRSFQYIIGSVSSKLQIKSKDILDKLNNSPITDEFEAFCQNVSEAETSLRNECEQFLKKNPFIQHKNGGFYKAQYYDSTRQGLYYCMYYLSEIEPS